MQDLWILGVAAIPLFVLFFIFLIFVIWIWALVDCIKSDLNPNEKILWCLIIIFLHVLGALLYFVLSRPMKDKVINVKNQKKLYRSHKNRMIGGVCGGIGEYFDVDPTIIRLAWVLVTLFSAGAGVLAYIIAWIIIPER